MPEGPEIRRAADEIAAAIAGRIAGEVFFAFEQLKPYEEILSGRRVSAVEAKGKAVLIHFANGYTIYSHNQLYGKWLIRPAYDYPNTKWNMHFTTQYYRYYIHGAYWHDNFGVLPVSGGCVNVRYEDMEDLYNFTEIGTNVTIM